VAIRPAPQQVSGNLSPDAMCAVSAWIKLNEAVLVDHWNTGSTLSSWAGG